MAHFPLGVLLEQRSEAPRLPRGRRPAADLAIPYTKSPCWTAQKTGGESRGGWDVLTNHAARSSCVSATSGITTHQPQPSCAAYAPAYTRQEAASESGSGQVDAQGGRRTKVPTCSTLLATAELMESRSCTRKDREG